MAENDFSLLVVDDEENNRDLLSRRLSKLGYRVTAAEDGRRALDVVRAGNIDLVLLDVMMPEPDGLQVLKQIRATHSLVDLPIIMVTARDQGSDIVAALQLGANDYLTKPLDFPVVQARVQTQLSIKARAQQPELSADLTGCVRLNTDEPGIGVIEMCADADKNALTPRMVAQLQLAFTTMSNDPNVRVVVLLGGSEVFCSGAPLDLLRELCAGSVAATELVLTRQLLAVPIPVVAALEGHATGGGLALACAADIVLIARESRYGANFMNLGFTPGMGTTRLLEYLLPAAVAHELLYTGEYRRGADFERLGAFNHVLPKAEVRPRALDLARAIAEKPRSSLEMLKRTLSLPRRQAWEQASTVEALMHQVSFQDADVQKRIEAEYVE